MRTLTLGPEVARELAVAFRHLQHAGLLAGSLRGVQHAATEAAMTGGAIVVVASGGHPDICPYTPRPSGDDWLDEVLTQQAAADEAGVDVKTISRKLNSGEIAPTYVDGVRRVRRRDLAKVYPFVGGTP